MEVHNMDLVFALNDKLLPKTDSAGKTNELCLS